MPLASFKRHRLQRDVVRHAGWLHFRFSLSLRVVEQMLAPRGIEVTVETIRCWLTKIVPLDTWRLRRRRPVSAPRWHLDERVCRTGGQRMYLWLVVDAEGEILDLVVQRRWDNGTELKLLARLLRIWPVEPEESRPTV